jgi:hypothetical protein
MSEPEVKESAKKRKVGDGTPGQGGQKVRKTKSPQS